MTDHPDTLARISTPRGELVLRRVGHHFEIISNGVFLMDTRDGRSERLLVEAALRRHGEPRRLLIGGLGVGFSLLAALSDPRVAAVTVVEIEPTLLEWHATFLAQCTQGAIGDPRVSVVLGDVAEHLAASSEGFDVVCLDVDNGPDWTVTTRNDELYDDAGVRLTAGALAPGGVMSVWSAHAVPAYEQRLRRHLDDVVMHDVPVERGTPDVVYVARRR